MEQDTTCYIPDCTAQVCARGLCKSHYRKDVKYGDPLYVRPKKQCGVDGCDRPYLASGWCELHYGRVRRGFDPGGVERRRAETKAPCLVEGCDDLSNARGLCPKHYQRYLRFGTADHVPPRAHPDAPVRPCKWCDREFDKRVGDRHLFCSDGCAEIVKNLLKRLSRYSMTLDQYKGRWREQDGRCALCRQPASGRAFTLAVDHDHACCSGDRSCGKCVRGLLCDRCNNGMGCFKDDPELMRRAAEYAAATRGAV